LGDEGAVDFVDPAIPENIAELAAPLRTANSASARPLEAIIGAEKELLAYDVIESVNNIFKAIAEAALAAVAYGDAISRGVGSTLAEAGRDYAGGLGKGFKRSAKKQGPKDGEKIFRWFRRFALAALTTSVGGGLWHLIAIYPKAFSWLEGLITFLL